MGKNPFNGRIIHQIMQQQGIKIKEPYTKQERPSLKGRIHKLPKSAFWERMSGWPLTKPEGLI
jgi:hypothetical protein